MKARMRRIACIEQNPILATTIRRNKIIRKAIAASKAGTFNDYMESLNDEDFIILYRWLSDSKDYGIDWAKVTDEDLDAAATNKIGIKDLRKKYPAQSGDEKE